MKLFEQLAAAIRKEHEQGELPDYLVAPLQRVVENAENHRDQAELVGQLTEQLSELRSVQRLRLLW